jgi:hypothetical protein
MQKVMVNNYANGKSSNSVLVEKSICDGDKSLFSFVEKDRIRKVKLLRKDDNGRHLL